MRVLHHNVYRTPLGRANALVPVCFVLHDWPVAHGTGWRTR